MTELTQESLLSLAARIVSAYVSKNPLPKDTLPELIGRIHQSIKGLGTGEKTEPAGPLVPAVPIKKSVTPDYIISLEDGRKFQSMKRHLGLLGMTPDEYRVKWGLSANYPMVAPNYAARRSELAKKIGLGRKAIPAKATPGKMKRKPASAK